MRRRRLGYITGILGLAIIVIAISVFVLFRRTSITDPFTAKQLSSVQFPLYYPTQLPDGYRIDKSTVQSPADNVIVFELKGPNNGKIYVSQQSRNKTFDYGGYYKGFQDGHQTVTDTGTIATGKIADGRTTIGSLATEQTWIIVNTSASIPQSDIKTILQSLKRSF